MGQLKFAFVALAVTCVLIAVTASALNVIDVPRSKLKRNSTI
jgi:hypothetical protein